VNEITPEQEQKIGIMGKMISKFLPGDIDMNVLIEEGKKGLEDFKDFKAAIELLYEKISDLEDRVNKLEKNP
tara:strand:+ start:421 stop:636 length:216 start_codon:yes stop_codon:yes gene_type:complete